MSTQGDTVPIIAVMPPVDFAAVRLLLSPVVALLAGEALQVVDVCPGAHHHLEGGDHLVARRAVASGAKQPGKNGRKKCRVNKCFGKRGRASPPPTILDI